MYRLPPYVKVWSASRLLARPVRPPAVALAFATGTLFLCQFFFAARVGMLSDPQAPVVRALLLLAVATILVATLSAASSALATLVGAAVGVRAMCLLQPVDPTPMVAWARGVGVNPPRGLVSALFSGSPFGVGQIALLLLWAGALVGVQDRRPGKRRVAALLVALAGLGAAVCALHAQPMLLSRLTMPSAESYAMPAWSEGALTQREWVRETTSPGAPARHLSELADSDQALAALAEGMASATHGPSALRASLWTAQGALDALQFALRGVALLPVALSFPLAFVALFRRVRGAVWLGTPAWILLVALAGGNVLLGCFGVFLPEGGFGPLPFHLAFAGFVVSGGWAALVLGGAR